jgi:RND family efflux transporter MFP subunit
MNRTFVALTLAACLGTGLAGCSRKKNPETVKAAGNDVAQPKAFDVSTSAAVERRIRKSVETVGTLVAQDEVTVGGQVGGEISQISVDIGTPVRAGQVIARISPREYELKLQQAEAALQQARAQLGINGNTEKIEVDQVAGVRQAKAALDDARSQMERTKKLVESGDLAQQRWDTAEANFRSADARYQAARDAAFNQVAFVEQRRSEVRYAKKKLDDSFVRAPISGIVSVKHKSLGELINEQGGNRDIVTIVQVNPLRVQANVAEGGVAYVKQGKQVTFTTDAYPGRDFPAIVSRISPVLNQQARLMMVEATAPNPQGLLKPGMFCKVQVDIADDVPATFVPSGAVISAAGLDKVFVAENGKAVERVVRIGKRDGDAVEIVEGVKPGEKVIVDNLERLSNGAPVSVK